jgi:hypothetical protein
VLGVEAPTDLDAGHERRLEGRNAQADEANEGRDPQNLHGPQAEPVPLEMGLDPIDPCVALFPRKQAGEMLHHARVAVQLGEQRPIIGEPAAEQEPFGPKFLW